MKFIKKDILKIEKWIAGVRDQLGRDSIPKDAQEKWTKQLEDAEKALRNIAIFAQD